MVTDVIDPESYGEEPVGVLPKTRKKIAGGALTQDVQPTTESFLPMARKRLLELSAERDKIEAEPVDMSVWQDYARKQGQAGGSSMLNALAAQYAGESFQPIQAQFLKRAAAAQEPIKVSGGILTPDGQLLKDPNVARDARRTALERQENTLLGLVQRAEQAQSDAERRKAQDEIQNQLRLMGLNIQQQGLAIRQAAAGNNNAGDARTWRAEDTLRGDFDKLTKDLREELNATGKITQIVGATPPGQKPDAITQQSLVILLNKFLDPGSVVREGEFDRVVKAQGLEGQARNLADRILKGQPLDANTIGQINGLARMYQQAATAKIQKHASDYADIAKRRGLSVESVISDPRFRGAAPAAGGRIRFDKDGNPIQ